MSIKPGEDSALKRAAEDGVMCVNKMRCHRMSFRTIPMFLGVIFLLGGCLHQLREIDLSKRSPSTNNVSYLLVDKSDYSYEGMVLVEKIDDRKLDLSLDPSVYIVDSGKHTISLSFRDFRKQGDSSVHELVTTLQPGTYYQVVPNRNKDEIYFELTEINKEKLKTVANREFRSMTNYLMRGEK